MMFKYLRKFSQIYCYFDSDALGMVGSVLHIPIIALTSQDVPREESCNLFYIFLSLRGVYDEAILKINQGIFQMRLLLPKLRKRVPSRRERNDIFLKVSFDYTQHKKKQIYGFAI